MRKSIRKIIAIASASVMALTFAVTSAHGGKVWAESVEGVGTSIIFTLKKAKNTDLS